MASAVKVTDSEIRHSGTGEEVAYIIRCGALCSSDRDEDQEGHEALVHINKY